MADSLGSIYSNLYHFLFVLLEGIIFIYFMNRLHRIESPKAKSLAYFGILCFSVCLIMLDIFIHVTYLSLLMGFILYPLIMKMVVKKPLYIGIIEYLYFEFYDFLAGLMLAVLMYSLYPESVLRTMPSIWILALYLGIFSLLNYLSYLTLGEKIFRLINYMNKLYEKNALRYFVGAFLILLWLGLFFSLNDALRELFVLSHNLNVLFWVFSIIVILTVSAFTLLFIFEQRKNYQALAGKSSKDLLTGAMTNTFGMEYLDSLVSGKNKTNFALVYLDIDNLKVVNDQLGHACGNIYICYIIDSIRQCISEGDSLIRTGGDEFLVVILNRTEQEVRAMMEHVLATLNIDAPMEISKYNVHFSYGLSIFNKDYSKYNLSNLIKEADEKMYQYKQAYKLSRSEEI